MRHRVQKLLHDFQGRQVARQRLPKWLATLMPIMGMSAVCGLTFACFLVLWTIHRALHPEISFTGLSSAAFILMFFPTFFGSMVPAFMLLNFVFVRIVPLKRIFDKAAEGIPVASYQASMTGLGRAAIIIVPPALTLAIIGAIEPWAY
jgi:hypothetical protein